MRDDLLIYRFGLCFTARLRVFAQHLTTQFLKNVSPVMATAANYYLRAAFFSDLGKKKNLTLALREVSVSETGCTCLPWRELPTPIQVHLRACIISPPRFSWQSWIVTHAREPSPKPRCTARSTLTPCTRIGLSQIAGPPPTLATRIE